MDAERTGGITRGAFVVGTSASAVAIRGTPALGANDVKTTPPPPGGGPITVRLSVNGVTHVLELEPRVTLLDALRDRLGLTGTKKGCDQGQCGACTVLVNGRRAVSCLSLAVMHEGDAITTVEGVAPVGSLHPLQRAFIERDAFQCGYCTSGQIVSALGFAAEGYAYERETVQQQMSGNICRCGCYPHIVDAVLEWRVAS